MSDFVWGMLVGFGIAVSVEWAVAYYHHWKAKGDWRRRWTP